MAAGEKVAECLIDEIGAVSLVIRPGLRFEPAGFRIAGPEIEVFGGGRKARFAIPAERRVEVEAIDTLLLLELADRGSETLREFLLYRDPDPDVAIFQKPRQAHRDQKD
jgi:hypothetical protein